MPVYWDRRPGRLVFWTSSRGALWSRGSCEGGCWETGCYCLEMYVIYMLEGDLSGEDGVVGGEDIVETGSGIGGQSTAQLEDGY